MSEHAVFSLILTIETPVLSKVTIFSLSWCLILLFFIKKLAPNYT